MKTPEQIEAVLAYCRSRTHCVEGVEWEGEAIAKNAVKRHVLRLLGESDLQLLTSHPEGAS